LSNFLSTIADKFNDLTNSQRIVASYITDNIDNVAFRTLDELAALIGVSTTTVIRFARTLGYEGYGDMQKSIQEEIREKVSLPERLTNTSNKKFSPDDLLHATFNKDIINLQNTLYYLNPANLQNAIDTLINANNIYILGCRSSFSLAYYMASRLGQFHRNVRLIQTVGLMFPEEIINVKSGDVCLAYMFPRYAKLSVSIVSWIKQHGGKIIIITSLNHHALKPLADIILPCCIDSESFKNSLTAPMCLSNYLAEETALKNYDTSMEILKKTEEILENDFW
jgi:DNA-binding MurR/RpiR family transcriptional regulator